MRFLHSMVRIGNTDASLRFYCELLGLKKVSRTDYVSGRYTVIFLDTAAGVEGARGARVPLVELTCNWVAEVYSGARNFGHLALVQQSIALTARKPWASMGNTGSW